MISDQELKELASLPGPQLRKRVKELQDRGIIPKFGLYAEAEGHLDSGRLTSGFKTWDKSPYQKDQLKPGYRKGVKNPGAAAKIFDVSEIRKRSDRERVESMAKRLYDAIQKQPWEAEMILRGMAAEYWRQGKPISYDEIKAIAAPFIETAAKTARESVRTSPPATTLENATN